jgi:pyruvate/2-oxoglutarate dehydrogenase complex dihydrolipoamide dehydrogenase (E3) component
MGNGKSHYHICYGYARLNAAQAIRKVADNDLLINGGAFRTTCAINGCMPTKIAPDLANTLEKREHYKKPGIEGAQKLHANREKMLGYRCGMREMFADLLPANTAGEMGYELIDGYAESLSPHPGEVYT